MQYYFIREQLYRVIVRLPKLNAFIVGLLHPALFLVYGSQRDAKTELLFHRVTDTTCHYKISSALRNT